MIFIAAGWAIRFSILVATVFGLAVRGLSSAAATVPQNNHPILRMAAAAIPAARDDLCFTPESSLPFPPIHST